MASRWRPATRGPGRVASRRPEPRRGASLRYGVKLSEASPLRLLTRQRRQTMTKVLVLYYSSYGHIEKMAEAVAQGVRDAGAEAIVKRVPELVPEEIAKKSGFKLDQAAPIATVAELPDYDAIIFGVPTRFGNMPAQMKNLLDQTGGHWVQGKLIGKPGSVFTSSATQHGGQESTIAVVQEIGGRERRLSVVELGEGDFRVGIDEGLLIDASHALHIADIEGVLGAAIAGVLAFELAMGFFFGFGFLQGRKLGLGEDDAVLGDFGFQGFQTLLHRLQIVALPHAADAGRRHGQPALS